MSLVIKTLGLVDYEPTLFAMQAFVQQRTPATPDEIWLCEHPPTFTQGLAGKPEHLLQSSTIPVVQTNRGGQITYHGPGQVVAYPLIDLKRAGYFVKEYVYQLEEATIRTLAYFGLIGHRVRAAPGVYVRLDEPRSHARLALTDASATPQEIFARERLGKIAGLGLKVSRQSTYHGVALNVAMDLRPFSAINPCGYPGLTSIDMASLGIEAEPQVVQTVLAKQLGIWLAPAPNPDALAPEHLPPNGARSVLGTD